MYWCHRVLGAMWLVKVSVTVSSSTDTHQSLRLFCTCINVREPRRKAASISDKELLFSHSFQERNQPTKVFCQCEYHLSTSWNIPFRVLLLQPSRTCNLENLTVRQRKILKLSLVYLKKKPEMVPYNYFQPRFNAWVVKHKWKWVNTEQSSSDAATGLWMLKC